MKRFAQVISAVAVAASMALLAAPAASAHPADPSDIHINLGCLTVDLLGSGSVIHIHIP